MRKVWLLALAGIFALVAGGCDVFNDQGGRENLPSSNLGQARIELNGGEASLRAGGNGGSLSVQTVGLDSIHVEPSGTVEDAIDVPAFSPAENLGTNPWIVTADATLDAYSDHAAAALALAEYYLVVGGDTVYQAGGSGPAAVTGLRVAKGRTLSLEVNIFHGATAAGTAMEFENDVAIQGTIEAPLVLAIDIAPAGVAPQNGVPLLNRAGLSILARQIFIRPSGVIASQGLDAPALSGLGGGHGGCVELLGWMGAFNAGRIQAGGGAGDGIGDGGSGAVCSPYLTTSLMAPAQFGPSTGITLASEVGSVINNGPVHAAGGDGANGGNGGGFGLVSYSKVYNTADLNLNGGQGLTGNGGNGGEAGLISLLGSYNQGKILAGGGDGAAGPGGNGGGMIMIVEPKSIPGLGCGLINRGEVVAKGGHSQDGIGGNGGVVIVENFLGGDLVNNARINLNGGDGDTLGGGGGMILIGALTVAIPILPPGAELPESRITVQGDLLLNGGAGQTGGNGGRIEIVGPSGITGGSVQAAAAIPKTVILPTTKCSIHLVGYRAVNFNGGDGGDGGRAGQVLLLDPAGEVASAADYQGRGGLGNTGRGGDGGGFQLISGSYMANLFGPVNLDHPLAALASLGAVAGQSGKVDLRGGDGFTQGGSGGSGVIGGDDGAGFIGTINLSGGNGFGDNAGGGSAGFFGPGSVLLPQRDLFEGFMIMAPFGEVGIEGVLIGNGGNATGTGAAGAGAYLQAMAGEKITSRADYSVRGGNADLLLGAGGYGGVVELMSMGPSTSHQGEAKVRGGDGLVPGERGLFLIDGILIKNQ